MWGGKTEACGRVDALRDHSIGVLTVAGEPKDGIEQKGAHQHPGTACIQGRVPQGTEGIQDIGGPGLSRKPWCGEQGALGVH